MNGHKTFVGLTRGGMWLPLPGASQPQSGTNGRQQQWVGVGHHSAMAKPLLILFGSVTGNSECCAEKAAHAARERGYDPTVENMSESEPEVMAQFPIVLIVTSTHGDGEPPDGTEDFYEAVVRAQRVRLAGIRFAVLALGDSCYDQFCRVGRDYDTALEQLGAERIHPRGECDTDYDDTAEAWISGVFTVLEEQRALLAA